MKTHKLWWIIHNLIAHPLLITGAAWAKRFHDWTYERSVPPVDGCVVPINPEEGD